MLADENIRERPALRYHPLGHFRAFSQLALGPTVPRGCAICVDKDRRSLQAIAVPRLRAAHAEQLGPKLGVLQANVLQPSLGSHETLYVHPLAGLVSPRASHYIDDPYLYVS